MVQSEYECCQISGTEYQIHNIPYSTRNYVIELELDCTFSFFHIKCSNYTAISFNHLVMVL